MLTNRAYLGERLHRGSYRKATWSAIKGLDDSEGRALFRRVGRVLSDRAGQGRQDSRAAHLLSLIALCGVCGDDALLKADQIGAPERRRQVYRCKEKRNVTITEKTLDAYVEQALIAWLQRKPEARAALIPDQGQQQAEVQQAQEMLDLYQEELREARQLNRTRNAQGRPLLSLTSLSEKEMELLPKIEEMERKLQAATGVPLLVQQLVNASDPQAMWNGDDGSAGLTLEQKREAIRQIVTVRVNKGRSGSGNVQPGRVLLSFIGTEGFRAPQPRARGTARGRGSASGTG